MNYTHTVHLPYPLPKPFNSWSAEWRDWLEKIDTQPIQIKERLRMPGHDGYRVDADLLPKAVLPWIAAAWLAPLNMDLFKPYAEDGECNCDARDLFNFGCKGH